MIDFIMLTYVFTYNNTPICSMYGIVAYIWVILLGPMLENIPAPWSIWDSE